MLPLCDAAQSQCPDRASKRYWIDEAALSGGASRQSYHAHNRAGLPSIRYFGTQTVEASSRLDDLPDRSDPNDRAAWPDECLARPGYTQFVNELRSAVAKRDAAGLRSLFAADGRMRLNGIGGTRNFADWGLERPEAAGIWPALAEILRLGCASRGERLYLPFMAAREEGADDNVLVALEDTAIRSSPAPTGRTVGLASRGSTLQSLGAATVEGWAHVAAADGSAGYVPDKSLRSPSSTMLVLANEQGSWRIRWFGGNI